MRFTNKLYSVSHFCLQFELTIFGVHVQNLCDVSRFLRFRVNSVLNHQLYLGESFLKYILFNSKLEVLNLIPKILNFRLMHSHFLMAPGRNPVSTTFNAIHYLPICIFFSSKFIFQMQHYALCVSFCLE